MPKYWGKQIFTQRRREKEEREKKDDVITMAKLCMAHASTHGARKPPGLIS